MVYLFQNTRSLVSCRKIYAPNHAKVKLSVEVINGQLDSDYIQPLIQNTINSWDWMNLLWTKWMIKISKISLMQEKRHQRYYGNFLVSENLSFNLQSYAGDQWDENFIYGSFIDFKINISQTSQISTIRTKIWVYHLKRNVITCFQIRESDHKFSLFCFLSYVPGLYFVSSCMW